MLAEIYFCPRCKTIGVLEYRPAIIRKYYIMKIEYREIGERDEIYEEGYDCIKCYCKNEECDGIYSVVLDAPKEELEKLTKMNDGKGYEYLKDLCKKYLVEVRHYSEEGYHHRIDGGDLETIREYDEEFYRIIAVKLAL